MTVKDYDKALRKNYHVTLRTVIRRLERTFARATPADIEAGAAWYPLAGELGADLAAQSGFSKACCVAVIAHLSPQTKWEYNLLAAEQLLVHKEVMSRLTGERAAKGFAAIDDDERERGVVNESRFGPKTLHFYRNIMGDREGVTIDVWALRAAGIYDDQKLSNKNVYEAMEYAYQVVARKAGLDPSTFQAVLWVVARGGRAA